MNKGKVLSVLLLALITAFIAVSCSGNIEAPASSAEELSYVTFGNGHSRELSTSYWTEDYDDLYWFYTAVKTDRYGTTGTKTEKTRINETTGFSGQVGPFSQGDWDFTLYAYKTADAGASGILVYASDAVGVTLKGGEIKNIPVSVTPQGAVGYVKFNNAYFEWAGESGDAIPKMRITLTPASGSPITTEITLNAKSDNKLSITNGTSIGTSVPVGYYTAKVSVYLKGTATDGTPIDNEGTPIFSQTFGLRVYGNAITYISGNMTEGLDSYVTFDVAEQTMKVFTVNKTENTEVKSAITSLNGNKESADVKNTEDYTTVTFPVGALDSSAVHQLDVAVTPIASAEQKFQVSGKINGQAAVSGIDLTMVKVQKKDDGSTEQKPVDSFNGKTVTVTTYIATGLSDVNVKYLKSDGTYDGISSTYEAASGRLIFTTTHFSQYVVVAPVEALNVSTGVPYTSLASAIVSAGDGQEIQLTTGANVTLDNGIANEGNNSRDITFIGDGSQTVDVITNTASAEGGQLNYQRGSSFTFENLTIQAGEGSFDGIVCDELTFNNCTIKGKLTLYGKATFINCTFENDMANQYSIWTWGGTDVKFDRCTFNTNGKAILLYGSAPTNLVVNNCTFNDRKEGAAGKAAIEIGNDYNATYTLTVNNATVSGFADGQNTGSKLWANKNSMGPAHLTVTIDGTDGLNGVTISGIAGVADFYNTIQGAYEAVKAKLEANSGLAEQALSEEAFNAFFTDGGKITWTIYGNQKVTDTRMFSFGRAANRFGDSRHITEINIVGGNSSASLDLSEVDGTFALPYNWWNVADSVNTALKCKNITFNGIKSMPSATFQCSLYSTTYEFDGCTFNGELYSYQNFDVNMTIKNCTFNAPDNTAYAFMSQGKGGSITLDKNVLKNYTRGINLQRATADFIVTNNTIVSTCSERDRGAIQLTDGKSFVVTGNKVDVNAGNAFWFHNAATNADVTYTISNNNIKAPYIGYSGVTAFDVNTKITSSGNTFNNTDTTMCMKKNATVAEATNLTAIH